MQKVMAHDIHPYFSSIERFETKLFLLKDKASFALPDYI
jgi:hypothetical protein